MPRSDSACNRRHAHDGCPTDARQESAGGAQEQAVNRSHRRTARFPAKDREFVPKHDDLEFHELLRPNPQCHEFEQPAKQQIEERHEQEASYAAGLRPNSTRQPESDSSARQGHEPDPNLCTLQGLRGRVLDFSRKNGSSGWTRTNNPPFKGSMQVVYLVDSSWFQLGREPAVSPCSGAHCSQIVRRTPADRPVINRSYRRVRLVVGGWSLADPTRHVAQCSPLANGLRMRTPRSSWPSLRSSVQRTSHPDSAAARTIIASQNPMRAWACSPMAASTSSAVGANTLQVASSRTRLVASSSGSGLATFFVTVTKNSCSTWTLRHPVLVSHSRSRSTRAACCFDPAEESKAYTRMFASTNSRCASSVMQILARPSPPPLSAQ